METLQTKDIIEFIGISVTFLIGIANFIISWRSTQITAFVNSVTKARVEYMQLIRNKMSEFCKHATALITENDATHSHKHDVIYLITLMRLLLKKSDPFDTRIIQQMESIKDMVFASYGLTKDQLKKTPDEEEMGRKPIALENAEQERMKLFEPEMEKLLDYTQAFLTLEWDGIKEESVLGKLSKEKKRHIYKRNMGSYA